MSAHTSPAPAHSPAKDAAITVPALARMTADGQKIAMLTAYDASFAAAADAPASTCCSSAIRSAWSSRVTTSTLPVTLDDVLYHTRCVARGAHARAPGRRPAVRELSGKRASRVHRVAPLRSRPARQMVKLEGGAWLAPTVEFLVARGMPVCGHVGLQPQSVNTLGGYRVQGKTPDAAEALLADAPALVAAGASLLVVECVPPRSRRDVTRGLRIPVIGIGAGPECSGQVLVIYDALGVSPGGRHASSAIHDRPDSIEAAIEAFVAAVKDGSFPGPEHCF